MPTNFPTSVDNFTNPTANDSLNLPSHSTQHANANDAIEAIEGYLLNGGQGLTLVKKQTIGSAVSSVTVTNAFSATYENYKIVIAGGSASTNNLLALRLGSTNTGYRETMIYYPYTSANAGTPFANATNNGATFSYAGTGQSGNSLYMDISLHSPFLTKFTYVGSQFIDPSNAGTYSGYLNNSTSYTDFTVIPNTGTITGGTIYVYGYGIGQ